MMLAAMPRAASGRRRHLAAPAGRADARRLSRPAFEQHLRGRATVSYRDDF